MTSSIHRFCVLSLLFLIGCSRTPAQETRGTWIARDMLGSRDQIARAMDSLAANNFTTVFVNVWSRGYPLFQSEVFKAHTGITIDPNYAGRDILQEAIAEGHRVGLHVEAWFEYGFVGGYAGYLPGSSGKGKIFDTYPHWVARQQNGTEIDGSSFYWMSHTRPDVQDFLIGLAAEVARKYDVDGIELDRIRYSSLNYGYDGYTDSLYKAENGGQAPPAPADTAWRRWRADKLNTFIARAYDSIKSVNPKIIVSNAPSLYSATDYSSYNSFCQDWVWWVNNGKVDKVHVQSYVASPATFGSYMDHMKNRVKDHAKVIPSFAIRPNGTFIGTGTATQMISATRSKGLSGNGIWYYTDLLTVFPELKAGPYKEKSFPPHVPQDWRKYVAVVLPSDSARVTMFGTWSVSASPGYRGSSLYAASSGVQSIDYAADVPVDGHYEVYVYTVTSSNRTAAAPWMVYATDGTTAVTVDQSKSVNAGWRKLADAALTAGRKKIVTLTNQGIGDGKLVSADAVMIVLNRRLSPHAGPTAARASVSVTPDLFRLLQNFPNPFNPATMITYDVRTGDSPSHLNGDSPSYVTLKVYDALGREAAVLVDGPQDAGTHSVRFDASRLSSGVYYYTLRSGTFVQTRSMLLLK